MSEGRHVFLSYRSTERPFALKLAAALRNAGVKLWVDCLPEGIRAGDDWPRALEEALNTCASAIAVLSPEYVASKVCRREIHRVDQLGRTIFPVLLRPVRPTEWPLEVERLQYVDFTGWMDDASFASALDKLVTRLRGTGGPVIGQRPDPEQQYLLTLIADLEARGGVSQYVALDAELWPEEREALQAIPGFAAAWGLDAEFTLLEAPEPTAARATPERTARPVANVLDLLREPNVFVLLGDPGAGKTTTLRRLALEAARRRLEDPMAPLPMFLALPQWRTEPDALSFIASRYPFEGDPGPAVAAGDIAIFLDGLNEMGADAPAHVELLRQWLRSPMRPRRLAVSCRSQDYADLDLRVNRITIEPMDQARVERFIRAYLGDEAGTLLARILPRPGDADRRSLLAIACNPYLLTCLIVLHSSAPEGALPRNMGRLFRHLTRHLWSRELRRQTAGWVPFEEGEAKLAKLAYAMIDEYHPTTVPRAIVNATIDDALLRFCEHASVLVVEGEGVRFQHQLLQEYLAAVALCDKPLAGHVDYSRWREVIVALCGILEHPDDVVEQITASKPQLAARCVLGGAAVRDETVNRVVRDLIGELQQWSERAETAEEDKQRERERYLEEHPNMPSGSIHMMDDALDQWFDDRPLEEIRACRELLQALGPSILPAIAEAAAREGPAASSLRSLAERLGAKAALLG